MATTEELLIDAEAAYHALLTGQAVVEVRAENGDMMKYNQANRSALSAYITSLKNLITPVAGSSGPMRIVG